MDCELRLDNRKPVVGRAVFPEIRLEITLFRNPCGKTFHAWQPLTGVGLTQPNRRSNGRGRRPSIISIARCWRLPLIYTAFHSVLRLRPAASKGIVRLRLSRWSKECGFRNPTQPAPVSRFTHLGPVQQSGQSHRLATAFSCNLPTELSLRPEFRSCLTSRRECRTKPNLLP